MRVSKNEALFYLEAVKILTGPTMNWVENLGEDEFVIEPTPQPIGGGGGGPTIVRPCAAPPTAGDFALLAALVVMWGKFVGLNPATLVPPDSGHGIEPGPGRGSGPVPR